MARSSGSRRAGRHLCSERCTRPPISAVGARLASHAATAPCSHPVPRPFVAIGRLLNSRANVVLCDFVWRNRWPLGVTFAVTMWIAAFHFNPRKYESTDAGMLQSVEEQLAARDEHDEQVAAAERIAELAAHR